MYICMYLLIYFTDFYLDSILRLFVHLFFPLVGKNTHLENLSCYISIHRHSYHIKDAIPSSFSGIGVHCCEFLNS